jgi:hypothetical protein
MTKRIVIGGIVAGIVMFIWGALSHAVLGLEESAIKQFPNEPVVMAALTTNLKEAGFYFFPGMDMSPNMTKEQSAAAQKAWTEKYLAGPRGILIYHPDGQQAMSPKQLGAQLVSEIIAAIIAAWLLSQATAVTCYMGRVCFVITLGLLPFLIVNFPYWNWYGFPGKFTLIELVDKVVCFGLAGLVLGAIVKSPQSLATPTSAAATATAK